MAIQRVACEAIQLEISSCSKLVSLWIQASPQRLPLPFRGRYLRLTTIGVRQSDLFHLRKIFLLDAKNLMFVINNDVK